MTFGSELTQKTFYLLPIDKQREYNALADYLAEQGKSLRLDIIIHDEYRLDVLIRVSDKFDLSGVTRGS